ncbi:MAG: glutamyl-tRNA reductase [Gammaproteobacteria bacterium]|nr:MAG: glutamyl-tRNA reductase [Gammaproteobacteria bacterium]
MIATMDLLAFGVNHNTAPVDIREQVAFAPERMIEALKGLTSQRHISEAAILSTCNRTEVYCGLTGGDASPVLSWFSDYHQLDTQAVKPYVYSHPDSDAVRHMLRVASGLDSMVLGEPQILGQMKDAYSNASKAGTVGKLLSRLFQHTFSVAKRVRTDTAIGSSPVSVAFAAVSLARQIFGELNKQTALLIGAGETIELAARHLYENGIGRMIISNRTLSKAQHLAGDLEAYAIALADMPAHLAEADIVISSTASQLPILGKGSVERALKQRKHKPMFMVDVAVPRDIEPEVDELDDVYLYSVDDLRDIIEENMESRREAAKQAEEIIDTQVTHFMEWMGSLAAVDTLTSYRGNAETLRDETLNKARQQLARGDNPTQVIEELARQLTNKLIHQPTVQIRQAGADGREDLLKAASELFDLEPLDDVENNSAENSSSGKDKN